MSAARLQERRRGQQHGAALEWRISKDSGVGSGVGSGVSRIGNVGGMRLIATA